MDIEKQDPTLSVGVLVFDKDKVLLVRHGEEAGHMSGTYGLPSGRLDPGETEVVAAARELNEETGLRSSSKDFIEYPDNLYFADINRKDGSVIHFSWRVFICKEYGGELEGSEETTPEWVELSKLSTYQLLPNVQKAALEGQKFLVSRMI